MSGKIRTKKFERIKKQFEQIIGLYEKGEMPLDEALRRCDDIWEQADLTISERDLLLEWFDKKADEWDRKHASYVAS